MTSRRLFPRSNPEPEANFEQFLTVPIGKGSYGTVYKAVHKKTFKKYAIKEIRKKGHQKFIHYQLKIMYSIDCQSIVKLYDHFQSDLSVYLILEFVEGKQLFEGVINQKVKLMYTQVARLIYQLCIAIEHIHSLGIIHRDIKPENIMLDKDGKLKLTDFGAANYIVENEARKTFIGTPQYMAPQLLYQNQQSTAVDVWAVGVILYQLTSMKLPFTAKTTPKIYQNIKNVRYQFPVCLERQYQLRDLIKRIFVIDANKRPTIVQVMDHPWVQTNISKNNSGITRDEIKPGQITSEDSSQFQKLQIIIKIQQLQREIEHTKGKKDTNYQKYQHQIKKKLDLLQNKIAVSKGIKGKRQKIMQDNQIHLEQLRMQINSSQKIKTELQNIRDMIQNGNLKYLSALEERKRLRAYELKLQQQIRTYKVGVEEDELCKKSKSRKRNMYTTSTYTSQKMRPQEEVQHKNNKKPFGSLQKSLSFSQIQIQGYLAQIKQRKGMIKGVQSSTQLLTQDSDSFIS